MDETKDLIRDLVRKLSKKLGVDFRESEVERLDGIITQVIRRENARAKMKRRIRFLRTQRLGPRRVRSQT